MLQAALFVLLCVPVPALAVPIGDIDVGDTYFINNLFSKNDLVTVRRVDRANGRVKIRYATGGTEWVSPSKLLGRTAARKKDAEQAIVGTALVAGAIWAILDPEGFKKAANSKQRSKPSPRSNGRTVNIAAVPFSPVVPGQWQKQGPRWVSWARGVLRQEIGKKVSIESVRTKVIPFYSSAKKKVLLAEAAENERRGAYYIVSVAGSKTRTLLDGKGGAIHRINRLYGLSLRTAAEATAYLEFFNSAISARDGIFLVLKPDADFLAPAIRRQIGIGPVRARLSSRVWNITSDVIYGNQVYEADFRVKSGGVVEMVRDRYKKDLAFKYRVLMDGARRVYVRN
tara:strand:+ start:1665 stop:2687 length:1023 start_codon:yes stop_codon:yes gene_type:complete